MKVNSKNTSSYQFIAEIQASQSIAAEKPVSLYMYQKIQAVHVLIFDQMRKCLQATARISR